MLCHCQRRRCIPDPSFFHLSFFLLLLPISQNVIRKWYFRDPSVTAAMEENHGLATGCAEALEAGEASLYQIGADRHI